MYVFGCLLICLVICEFSYLITLLVIYLFGWLLI